MRRLCLILIVAVFLGGCSAAQAREPADSHDSVLSDYLHSRRLPLVEARLINNGHGDRSVLLYGYVATEFGKEDAENKVRDFMDDPDIAVTNRIKVTPELLALGKDQSETAAENSAAPDDNNQQANANLPDDIQGPEAYANQERNDALLQANGVGIPLGLPLIMAIMNSGVVAGPLAPPPMYGPPTFFNQMPPIASVPPVIIIRPMGGPPAAFGPFPTAMRPNYFPSPFPAGPAPMFPATGGMPFPSAAPAFGAGFAPHGFPSTFPSGGFPAGGFPGGGFTGGGFGFGHR